MIPRIHHPSLLDVPMGREVADWWLIFRPTVNWYRRLLRPGFGHVYAMRRHGTHWVRFDPGSDFTHVEIIDDGGWSAYQLAGDATEVVRVVSYLRPGIHRYPYMVGAVSCVEAVKSLLGISHPAIWTPYQLFRYCQRHRYRLGV